MNGASHLFEALPYQEQLRRLQHLGEEALSHYHLHEVKSVLLQYEDNAVYRIIAHTGEQFVLRVSAAEGQNVAEQRSEMQWLTRLRQETSLLVPEPVPNVDGAFVTTIEVIDVPRPRHCVLLRWVPGDPPTSAISAEDAEHIGAFTARLHKHAEHVAFPAEFVRPNWDWDRLFGMSSVLGRGKAITSLSPHQHEILEAVSVQLQQGFSLLGKAAPLWGLIHADLHRDNILLHHGEIGVIDFDDCGWGYYLFDLASVLDSLYRRVVNDTRNYQFLREAYLKGYDHIRSLPNDFEDHLRMTKVMRDIVTLNFILGSKNASVQTWGSQRANQIFVQLEAYLEGSPVLGI